MAKKRTIITDCKKATFLIEKQQVSKLSFTELLFLNLHLTSCSLCRIFRKQSIIINHIAHKLFHASTNTLYKLSVANKKEMQQRIDRELGIN